jgi:hypothetical protein
MANQVTVNKNNGIQVVIEPPANVQVELSRAVIGTVANVQSANIAKTVTNNAQPNITSVGTLTNLAIAGDLTTVDSITLDTAASEAYATAKMYWNTVDGTMNVGLYNGVIQQIGQEVHFYGKAQGNITNGQVVMFAGVQGDHILMTPANASAPGFKKEWIIGIATQNIANGSFGYVTWFGKINDVSTNGFPAGAILWFNPSVPGGLTNIEPTGNSIKVLMAAVIKAETSPAANNGIYLVRPTFEPNINDIQGVKVQSPLQGQVMTYDAANSVWINANITANVSNVQYAANAGHANVADVAYSVAIANIVGIGNIATVNLNGNAQTILLGNGAWSAMPNTETANYANYAGEAFSVNAGNISGTVNLANYATVANSVAGANVSGDVSGANHANVADVANTVAGANVTGTVAYANYASYAGAAYSVSGSNVSGEVANANYASYAGVAGTANSVAGANISGEVANANYATYSGTSYSVSGSNVSGEVSNANFATTAQTAYSVDGANVAGDVSGANHANISDVANSVSGSNVVGEVANAAYATSAGSATVANSANSVAGANVSGEVANAAYATSAGSALVAGSANSVAGANVSGEVANAAYATNAGSATVADSANSVAGANVAGDVAGANHANIADVANSVTAANVSGLGNIATINLDGNASSVLLGNGYWGALPSTENANYANFAGTAYSVDGANVNGEVANAAYATSAGSANSVAGANVSGEVANANYASYAGNATVADSANSVTAANVSGLGNIVTLNITGNTEQWLRGDGTWNALPAVTNVANANYSNFAGTAYSIDGANVSGEVANANYANFAGTAYSVDLANVVGIGNIASLNIDGNASNVLRGDGTFSADSVTSPAGSNTQIQFNDGGAFGASANLFWDKSSNTLNVSGNIVKPANIGGTMLLRGSDSFLSNIVPGALQAASGNLGNATTLISVSANVGAATTGIFGGSAFTDNVAGFRVNAGALNLRSGNITSNIANSLIAGGTTLNGSVITYRTANSITGSTITISGSNVTPSGNDYSVAGTLSLAPTNWTFGNANLRYSNGNIGTILTPFVNIGHNNGIGVELVGNTSNITVGNVTPIDALYMRTTGVGIGSGTTGNINNVTFGNITTAAMNIETGQFKKPTGSNVSNVTVGNLTTGDINFRTGGVNDITSVTGTYNRGNINLTSKAINFYTGGNGMYDYTYQYTFNSNGQASLGNLVTGNYFQGDGGLLSNITANFANTANIANSADVAYSVSGANSIVGNLVEVNYINSNELQWNTGNGRQLRIWGSNTAPVGINMYQGSMNITMDNLEGGAPSFDFKTYMVNDSYQPPYTYFRASGTQSSPGPVANGTPVVAQQWNVYKDSGNTYSGIGSFRVSVANNPGIGGNYVSINTAYSAADSANSRFDIGYGTIRLQGNVEVNDNLTINDNASVGGVFKFGVYSISGKPATGNVGEVISINDSTPIGMLAYWDGTNSRWSYVHDNSAV